MKIIFLVRVAPVNLRSIRIVGERSGKGAIMGPNNDEASLTEPKKSLINHKGRTMRVHCSTDFHPLNPTTKFRLYLSVIPEILNKNQ